MNKNENLSFPSVNEQRQRAISVFRNQINTIEKWCHELSYLNKDNFLFFQEVRELYSLCETSLSRVLSSRSINDSIAVIVNIYSNLTNFSKILKTLKDKWNERQKFPPKRFLDPEFGFLNCDLADITNLVDDQQLLYSKPNDNTSDQTVSLSSEERKLIERQIAICNLNAALNQFISYRNVFESKLAQFDAEEEKKTIDWKNSQINLNVNNNRNPLNTNQNPLAHRQPIAPNQNNFYNMNNINNNNNISNNININIINNINGDLNNRNNNQFHSPSSPRLGNRPTGLFAQGPKRDSCSSLKIPSAPPPSCLKSPLKIESKDDQSLLAIDNDILNKKKKIEEIESQIRLYKNLKNDLNKLKEPIDNENNSLEKLKAHQAEEIEELNRKIEAENRKTDEKKKKETEISEKFQKIEAEISKALKEKQELTKYDVVCEENTENEVESGKVTKVISTNFSFVGFIYLVFQIFESFSTFLRIYLQTLSKMNDLALFSHAYNNNSSNSSNSNNNDGNDNKNTNNSSINSNNSDNITFVEWVKSSLISDFKESIRCGGIKNMFGGVFTLVFRFILGVFAVVFGLLENLFLKLESCVHVGKKASDLPNRTNKKED